MTLPNPFVCLFFGIITAYFAKTRGKNPFPWFFLGMAFGILGIAFLLVSTRKEAAPSSSVDGKTIDLPPPYDPAYNQKFWYYLDQENKRHGPLSFEALYRLYTTSTLSPETYVWNEGLEDWKPLKNFLD